MSKNHVVKSLGALCSYTSVSFVNFIKVNWRLGFLNQDGRRTGFVKQASNHQGPRKENDWGEGG